MIKIPVGITTKLMYNNNISMIEKPAVVETFLKMGGLRKYTNAYLPKPKYLGWVDPF